MKEALSFVRDDYLKEDPVHYYDEYDDEFCAEPLTKTQYQEKIAHAKSRV